MKTHSRLVIDITTSDEELINELREQKESIDSGEYKRDLMEGYDGNTTMDIQFEIEDVEVVQDRIDDNIEWSTTAGDTIV